MINYRGYSMENNIIQRYEKLPLGNICDANGKNGSMDHGIKPVFPTKIIAGPAFTVQGQPGDNLPIHRGMLDAPEGSILVVDCGGYCQAGHFGEIMATACKKKGLRAIVIDGGIRDADELAEVGFPVFCRAVNPNGTVKESIGRMGVPIICGGIHVESGDLIVTGNDGVVVVQKDNIMQVLAAAETIAAKEIHVLDQIAQGKNTAEIYGFTKILNINEG